MKMKQRKIAAAVILAGALLAGCSQNTQTEAEYIGIQAAQEAAVADAGVAFDQADFQVAGLDQRDGTFYYQVNFEADGIQYEYAIDALTGVVIEENTITSQTAQADVQPAASSQAAQGDETAPAETVQTSQGDETPPAQSSEGVLDQTEVLEIALSDAGMTQDEIRRLEVERDYDDRRMVYEIGFYGPDGQEYDYKIDAVTGEIISYDYDDNQRNYRESLESQAMISEDQAKEQVISRVPGASAEDIFLRLEEDDGRMEYEGKLVYDGMEYEFKIDAYSGDVREWEADPIYDRR